MDTDLRKNAKNNLKKDFFKLMNNVVFTKAMENVRRHRDIKLVTIERRRNYFVKESNHHATKFPKGHLLAKEKKLKRSWIILPM